MRYKRKFKYSLAIPKPKGSAWISYGKTRLWLSDFAFPDKKESWLPAGSVAPSLIGPGYAIARDALGFMMTLLYSDKRNYELDWVVRIDQGLSKEIYRIDVIDKIHNDEQVGSYAVGIVLNDAPENAESRIIKEQELLQSIYNKVKYYSISKPIGVLWQDGLLISITEFIRGHPIELRTSKSRHENPWEIIARVAAETHNISKQHLPSTIKHYSSWKEHVNSKTIEFQKFSHIQEIHDALIWIDENISEEQESVLVHSDLLGQNILLTLDGEIFLIDWEYSFVGNPAYDLAIVTRGAKKPFQVASGLDKLLDAYWAFGGQKIEKKDVHIFEIILNFGWYEDALDRSQGGHAPEYYLDAIARLLNRASKSV
ncbi:phosphotransferase [candidate division KSB1 bacterium]|nr:phosphotransferase [candidate division KSB1 bacterium]